MKLICVEKDGFRDPNKIEEAALRFTFGEKVGNWLIGIIRVEYEPILAAEKGSVLGRVANKTEIEMRSDYNSYNLWWLSIFIHEAAHIWQRNTGCNRTGETDYRYFYTQLPTLRLGKEEHASAVQHWFYGKFGIKHNLFRTEDHIAFLRRIILLVFGFEPADEPSVILDLDGLEQLLEVWDPVLDDIRDPKHMTDSICDR